MPNSATATKSTHADQPIVDACVKVNRRFSTEAQRNADAVGGYY